MMINPAVPPTTRKIGILLLNSVKHVTIDLVPAPPRSRQETSPMKGKLGDFHSLTQDLLVSVINFIRMIMVVLAISSVPRRGMMNGARPLPTCSYRRT